MMRNKLKFTHLCRNLSQIFHKSIEVQENYNAYLFDWHNIGHASTIVFVSIKVP